VIGANIANILGTFFLGPIIRPLRPLRDDRNYAMLMALSTTAGGLLSFWNPTIGRATGGILVVAFLICLGILLWTLKKVLVAIRYEREEDDDEQKKLGAGLLFSRLHF
jgi:Ca2+/Na+ antiporter